MLEIKGKVNTALCYAKVVEDVAIEQIRRMCDYALTEGSRIRIMPDVHAGKGCTIGTTMTVADKVCPNIVGVDIGCGMYTVRLGEAAVDFERVDEACHFIPSGMNVWEGRTERFDLTVFGATGPCGMQRDWRDPWEPWGEGIILSRLTEPRTAAYIW